MKGKKNCEGESPAYEKKEEKASKSGKKPFPFVKKKKK